MRLRVLDFNCPLFWFTIFYQKRIGEPWIEASIWSPHRFKNQPFWLHVWKWENLPDTRPMEAVQKDKDIA